MSALSELFQDIADAIRSKTGNSGKMKPIDFPNEILNIEAGGSGGGGGTVVSKSGTFIATADKDVVVTHDLGVTPDLIVVWTNEPFTGTGLLVSIGKGPKLYDSSTKAHIAGYQNPNDTDKLYWLTGGLDSVAATNKAMPIYGANASTFTVGGTMLRLGVDKEYYYEVTGILA